ncbi:hypothetical protein FRACYDRAFT_241522 [Fragilariopsis cylindrus CCMP1102]|uniref:Uncharacterized protein n=1 Tax=Fragilariopsis cylindrus CCMP1102 TaxID=635003 RepID=A0A1E7FAU7_9STRA|nr:hypothetical protein FRACYDRAFT_241522 [Fragilariopsis cylindrus CCMP1102]|eukprot:OEU14963.1 hypothetical protein FRACYDRAFT_241522 [Fragilariopsis cylindrus CCMP1102]
MMKAMLARKKMEEEMEKNTLVDITYCVTDDDRALWDIFEERTVLLGEELGGYGDNDIRSNNDEQEIVLQTYTVDIAAVAENRRCPMLKEQMMVQFVCENCNKVARDVDPPRSQCSRCWVVVAYCSLECQEDGQTVTYSANMMKLSLFLNHDSGVDSDGSTFSTSMQYNTVYQI